MVASEAFILRFCQKVVFESYLKAISEVSEKIKEKEKGTPV